MIKEINKGLKHFWEGILKEFGGGNEYKPLYPLKLTVGSGRVTGRMDLRNPVDWARQLHNEL